MLEREFQYYIDHQKELVEKYNGKYLVIKDEQVVGIYDTLDEAAVEADKKHKGDSYLIQECLPGEENFTITYHSRAVFV